LAHEPDEQALRSVVARDAGHDRDLALEDGRGFGIGGRGRELRGRLILGRLIVRSLHFCWHWGWPS
jgi:hypothetical protein